MKKLLVCILITIGYNVLGQNPDRRGTVRFVGINDLKIAPDNSVWVITWDGDIYSLRNFDRFWYRQCVSDEKNGVLNMEDMVNLENIAFFNRKTAIIAAHIEKDQVKGVHLGYLKTTDGGQTWQRKSIYGIKGTFSVAADSSGKAWLGSTAKSIYYTRDFAQTFKRLILPFKYSDTIIGIYMANPTSGIAIGNRSELLITHNNWRTCRKIKAPEAQYDQYDLRKLKNIFLWNSYIVIKSKKDVYYSDTGNIRWKSFPIRVHDVQLDGKTGQLYLISEGKRIYTVTSPEHPVIYTSIQLPGLPLVNSMYNGILYSLKTLFYFYKVEHDTLTYSSGIVTNDKIYLNDYPYEKGVKTKWIVHFDHIYISNIDTDDWRRVGYFPFYIPFIKPIDDSSALLFTDKYGIFTYSIRDKKLIPFHYVHPLRNFLNAPVKSIYFRRRSGNGGCMGRRPEGKLEYNSINDSMLESSDLSIHLSPDCLFTKWNFNLSKALVKQVLMEIDSVPEKKVVISDFNITQRDSFTLMGILKSKYVRQDFDSEFYKKQKLYVALLHNSEHENDSILNLLYENTDNSKFGNNVISLRITNMNGDTMYAISYENEDGWHLPWRFYYKEYRFKSYSVPFSRFIKEITPTIPWYYDFSNAAILEKLGNYLWENRD